MRSISNEFDCKAIIRSFKHAESFSKAKITHDIKGKIIAPVRHILSYAPAFLFQIAGRSSPETVAECSDICQNVPFHLLDGTIRERMAQNAPLACVGRLVNTAVSVESVLCRWENGVEV